MNTKIKSAIALAIGLYFFSACNNGTETDKDNKDTAAISTMNSDTMDKKMSMDDTSKMDNGLMSAMSKMMDKMNSMQMSGDFDMDFANMLIEHHQGAIDMAQVEVSKGNDEKMKATAQKIITMQTQEQDKLRDIVKNSKPSGMKMGEGELQKSMSAMNSKMKSMQMRGNVDKDFATMMMSHHQDGISMSKMERKNGMNSKLKQLVQKGITDQQKDISEFKAWLFANK